MTNSIGVVMLMSWVAAFFIGFGAFAVHLYRGEGTTKTPAGGTATPRTVPPAGPQQPISALSSPDQGTDRCRPTVVPGVPGPSITVPMQELTP